MCGILGIIDPQGDVANDLYRGGQALQHRGQDGAGLATFDRRFHRHTGLGLLSDIFRFKELAQFPGKFGLMQLRYATAGDGSADEVQPFLLSFPHGLGLVHNGNLTNDRELRGLLEQRGYRRVNSLSDSETLLHVFADSLTRNQALEITGYEDLFEAAQRTMLTCQGAYSTIVMVADRGLLAFRDAHGIRPLCMGRSGDKVAFASESVALDVIGMPMERDLLPGEAVFVDLQGRVQARQLVPAKPAHCVFEYIYLARPESLIEGRSVSAVRERLGECLAQRCVERDQLDVVFDVPSSAEDTAVAFARETRVPYRKGIRRNPYIQRSFIAANQALRSTMVGTKFLFEKRVIDGKRVALIDDSIVRGTTARRLVDSLRKQGAWKIHFFSASPPVRHPCYYGIDMAVKSELTAASRSSDEVAREIGVDRLQYQTIEDMESCLEGLPLCTACFSGRYPTPIDEQDAEETGRARAKISQGVG